jgi:chromosome segregation ATPase
MTTEQRLDRVEDDLAVVRQLLTSAATYAESAKRQLDRVGEKLDQAVSRQDATDAQIDRLTQRVDQLSSRMDEFVFHTQRIFNQQATVLERADGRSERLEAIMQRLDRSYEEQKSQFKEFQRTTGAALERIDRVLDYLLRQIGGDAR